MTRTATLATGIVLVLLAAVAFGGRFRLPEVWQSDLRAALVLGLAWVLLLTGALLLVRAVWPRRHVEPAPTEEELFEDSDDGRRTPGV